MNEVVRFYKDECLSKRPVLSAEQGTGAAALAGTDDRRVAEWRSTMISKFGRASELAEIVAKDKESARTGTESRVDSGAFTNVRRCMMSCIQAVISLVSRLVSSIQTRL
jgi:hypothetical protein